jgi:hypothetical protein
VVGLQNKHGYLDAFDDQNASVNRSRDGRHVGFSNNTFTSTKKNGKRGQCCTDIYATECRNVSTVVGSPIRADFPPLL